MSRQPTDRPAGGAADPAAVRRLGALVLGGLGLLLTVGGGAWTVAAGQDRNWDQRNYHLYSLHALTEGRELADLAPAGRLVSWVVSYWSWPWAVAIEHLPARAVGFGLGATAGLVVWSAALLAWRVLAPAPPTWRVGLTVGTTAVAGSATAVRTEFGTTFGDLTTALPVLLALWLHLGGPLGRYDDPPRPAPAAVRTVTVGALLGLAVAAKLSNAIFVVAFAAGWLAARGLRRRDVAAYGWLAVGGLGGYLLLNGWWAWRLWRAFGNPVFPYANGVFRSPWAPTGEVRDDRWVPETPGEVLSLPFRMARTSADVGEHALRDPRWAVLAVLGVCALAVLLARAARGRRAPTGRLPPAHRRFLLGYLAVAFLLWDVLFSIARYLPAAELVTGLGLLALLDVLVVRRRAVAGLFVALGVAVAATTTVPDFGRQPYAERWLEVAVPPLAEPARTLVVVTELPVAYVVAFFPAAVRFVRLGNWAPVGQPTTRLDAAAQTLVRDHDGPRLALVPPRRLAHVERQVGALGLQVEQPCQPLVTTYETLQLCPIRDPRR